MDIVRVIEEKGLLSPKRLTISITTHCNLSCEHCWIECAGDEGPSLSAPTDGIKRLIKELVDIGSEEVCLTGGEPFTHPDFLEILTFCQSLSLQKIHVQTNATLMTDKVFESMASVEAQKLNFQVSLDGGSAATHDLVRGNGSFLQAISGISQLVAHGYGSRTTLGFTEMQHNLHEVPALLRLAAEMGVASVIGWSIVQYGKAQYTEKVTPPLPEQYAHLLELYHADQEFKNLYEEYGCFSAIEWFKGRDQPSGQNCCFIEKPYVSATGTFYPCVLLQEEAYAALDLYRRPLDEAIREKIQVWTKLREETIRRRQELECFNGCTGAQHCVGGCFARATVVGTKRGVEDRCQLRRAIYEWQPPCG